MIKRGDDMEDKKEPFNDVIDHFNKIEGNVADPTKTKLRKQPKPIRFIGYFSMFFILITFLLIIILSIVK
ncbi:amino acid transporter [Neobacillus niacini]|uniref:amino acid transporter n=1 Tax=Neobacillus niacini TaxID=86668 RepID=UPI002859C4C4|nr:amino acid transporter [Neobacillus niacini]MDR7002793.1 hypothetical protein [Neobacillus niacini]